MAGLALGIAVACGNDPTGPSMRAVAGNYVATQLVTTENGTVTNRLAAGSSVTLTLNVNGTSSGRLVVPEAGEADLVGTWTLRGTTVQLSQAADTFIRNMPLEVQGNTLVGDRTFSGTRIQMTLTKQ